VTKANYSQTFPDVNIEKVTVLSFVFGVELVTEQQANELNWIKTTYKR